MINLKDIKTYIHYIKGHMKETRHEARASRANYNKEVRGCILASTLLHDINKIFTFKILNYTHVYRETIDDVHLKIDCYNKKFSKHDMWMYSPTVMKKLNEMEILKYISRFNRNSFIQSDEEVYSVIDNIKMLCSMFGEDPRAFYLRNYYVFRFGPKSLARIHIEDALDINFDDYFDKDVVSITLADIFNKSNEYFNPGLAYHAFITCLTQYGVNVYESLGLTDTYVGINDEV